MRVQTPVGVLGDGPSDFYVAQAYDVYGNPLTKEQTGYTFDCGEMTCVVPGTMNLVDLTKDAGIADSFTVQRAYELSPAYQNQEIRTNPLATVYATPEQMKATETIVESPVTIPVAAPPPAPVMRDMPPPPAPAPAPSVAAPAPAPSVAAPGTAPATGGGVNALYIPPTPGTEGQGDYIPGEWTGPGGTRPTAKAPAQSKSWLGLLAIGTALLLGQ